MEGLIKHFTQYDKHVSPNSCFSFCLVPFHDSVQRHLTVPDRVKDFPQVGSCSVHSILLVQHNQEYIFLDKSLRLHSYLCNQGQTIQLKMGTGLEQTITQGRCTHGQQMHEKIFDITNHQETTNQNHSELLPHILQGSD